MKINFIPPKGSKGSMVILTSDGPVNISWDKTTLSKSEKQNTKVMTSDALAQDDEIPEGSGPVISTKAELQNLMKKRFGSLFKGCEKTGIDQNMFYRPKAKIRTKIVMRIQKALGVRLAPKLMECPDAVPLKDAKGELDSGL